VIYPPPCVLANELIKGPRFLVQVAIVLAPRVGLSWYGLRQLADSRGLEIKRDQAALYSPGGRHVYGNRREGPQRVYEHLQADVFLSRNSGSAR
jgi:hypothetical protein